ncbi:MAG: HNH endonuclease signature motif containing protein [Pseudomonadota bacterium]|nr:HNH endonuclease signature motif containing protein [Pseudomonadota bacterium]
MTHLELVEETRVLVKYEKEVCAKIIRNLSIINEKQIYLEMKYGSLRAFCIDELKMCPATAQRRVDAVTISQSVPDIADRIEKGEISLTRVGQVAKFVRDEKKIVDRDLSAGDIKAIVNDVQGQVNEYDAAIALSIKSEIVQKPVLEKTRILAGGRQTMEMEVNSRFLMALQEMRHLLSHQGYQSKADILLKAMDFYLLKNHPGKQAESKSVTLETLEQQNLELQDDEMQDTEMQDGKLENVPAKKYANERYVSKKLRQQVWRACQSKCTFGHSSGKRCDSTFRLQVEHIHPIALGGKSDIENLTLLCQAHSTPKQALNIGVRVPRFELFIYESSRRLSL